MEYFVSCFSPLLIFTLSTYYYLPTFFHMHVMMEIEDYEEGGGGKEKREKEEEEEKTEEQNERC